MIKIIKSNPINRSNISRDFGLNCLPTLILLLVSYYYKVQDQGIDMIIWSLITN